MQGKTQEQMHKFDPCRKQRGRAGRSGVCSELIVGCLLLITAVNSARGHDGGFGHSTRTVLVTASRTGFVIDYRVRLAAEEALVEMTRMDANSDGKVTEQERDSYLGKKAAVLREGLRVKVGIVPATAAVSDKAATLDCQLERIDVGHSLTQTFRFVVATSSSSITIEDRNFLHQPGQVRVWSVPGVTATVPRSMRAR